MEYWNIGTGKSENSKSENSKSKKIKSEKSRSEKSRSVKQERSVIRMTKQELWNLCKKHPIYLDGATGSNLIKRGMPAGVCPEKWILENKQIMLELQREYVEAGSNIIYAPTFTSNRIKLAEYGLEDRIQEINESLVKISKEAAGDKAYVAADITMTGLQLKPIGPRDFEE